MASIYDVPGGNPLIDQFVRSIEEPAAPSGDDALQRALAERERIMAERNQSAPIYMPGEGTQQFGRGGYASIPSTAGYTGPTRTSDLIPAGGMPGGGILRSPEEQRLRGGPLTGSPGRTRGDLMDLLLSSKGAPKEAIDELLRTELGINPQQFNQRAGQDAAQRRAEQIHQTQLNNIGVYFNKRTGNTAAEDFVDAVPTTEQLNRDYVPLKTRDQRDALSAVQGIDQQLEAYREALKAIPMPEEASPINALTQGATVKFKSLYGEKNVRNLESLQARLMGLARAFGGTSKNIDTARELDRLEKAIPSAMGSRAAADNVLGQLESFRDNAAKTIPIPGIHNRYAKTQQRTRIDPATGRKQVWVD